MAGRREGSIAGGGNKQGQCEESEVTMWIELKGEVGAQCTKVRELEMLLLGFGEFPFLIFQKNCSKLSLIIISYLHCLPSVRENTAFF
jgi:hypothetical protein